MNAFPLRLLAPKHWLTWAGVGLLFVVAWLPWRARRWLGKRLGAWLYRHNHKRRHIVLTNLRLCFSHLDEPQREAMAQEHLQEYACALLDYSVLFFRSRHWLYQRIHIDGREHIDRAIAAQQNVILLVAHSVWLEFAGSALGEHYRITGFYKPFSNPIVNWLVARSRLHDAEVIVSREEGMMKLIRTLEPGRLMFFLPDEDHGEKYSVFAPFFGIPKATLTTPARLSKLTNAVALPVIAYFNQRDGRYHITVSSPLPNYPSKSESQNAENLNMALQQLVEAHPPQYMWVLRLFRSRPANEEPLY